MFHYYLLGGDTTAPSWLYVRFCYAFLVCVCCAVYDACVCVCVCVCVGALFAFEMLCLMLGRLFEPYVVHLLPHLLLCFGDNNQYVREVCVDMSVASCDSE